jgi:hypothetical protein
LAIDNPSAKKLTIAPIVVNGSNRGNKEEKRNPPNTIDAIKSPITISV